MNNIFTYKFQKIIEIEEKANIKVLKRLIDQEKAFYDPIFKKLKLKLDSYSGRKSKILNYNCLFQFLTIIISNLSSLEKYLEYIIKIKQDNDKKIKDIEAKKIMESL